MSVDIALFVLVWIAACAFRPALTGACAFGRQLMAPIPCRSHTALVRLRPRLRACNTHARAHTHTPRHTNTRMHTHTHARTYTHPDTQTHACTHTHCAFALYFTLTTSLALYVCFGPVAVRATAIVGRGRNILCAYSHTAPQSQPPLPQLAPSHRTRACVLSFSLSSPFTIFSLIHPRQPVPWMGSCGCGTVEQPLACTRLRWTVGTQPILLSCTAQTLSLLQPTEKFVRYSDA